MAFAPATIVHLCNVPIDMTQQNQIRFPSVAAQTAYFGASIVHSFSAFTYVQKDNYVQVDKNIDELWNVNYIMYDNTNFSGKWFYGFIAKMEYMSQYTTRVYFDTDVYQTWMLSCNVLASFVEREHEENDAVGVNQQIEPLEHGEYIKVMTDTLTDMDQLAAVLAVTQTPAGVPIPGGMYSGVYAGVGYQAFFGAGLAGQINAVLDTYLAGTIEAVLCIFMIPRNALPSTMVSGDYVPRDQLAGLSNSKAVTYNVTTVGGYTPKNKKLFQYPYNFLHVTNLQGQSADYRFELLESNTGTFNFSYRTNVAPGAKTMMIPLSGYKNPGSILNSNPEEALTIGNYPLCCWTYDAWKQWVGQNALPTVVGLGSSMVSMAGGFALGNPMAIAGGAVGITQQMAEMTRHMIEPDHAKGNTNGSTVNVAWGMQHFQFIQMQIQGQYAERIDNYFSMFGYKQNKVKVPNMSSRPYWNYVKTNGINITGAIPGSDMSQLKKIFDDGVTLWHNGANVGNYSLDNSEV